MHTPSHRDSGCAPMPAAMVPPRQQAPLHLAPVGAQTGALDCAGGRLSAEAGVVRLTDLEAPLGCTRHRAAVLADPRAPRRLPCT